MNTHLDCIPCFFNQILDTASRTGIPYDQQKEIINRFCKLIPEHPLEASPPELSSELYRIISSVTGIKDPYKGIKKECNMKAMELYPGLSEKLEKDDTPLLKAVRLAICGNLIDYGLGGTSDPIELLNDLLDKEDNGTEGLSSNSFFMFDDFENKLRESRNLLYLGDNAGEIVFDRILIETIKKTYPELNIVFAVRGGPIINDVTLKDAEMVGFPDAVKVISSGSKAPGTLLKNCTPEFIDEFRKSDMIISKGQGNYESLSDIKAPLFFLFMIKCPIVSAHTNIPKGTVALINRKSVTS